MADDRHQINMVDRADMRLHLDAAQRHEIIDQTAHPAGLLVHDLKEAVARRLIVAGGTLQGFDEAGERGQRRAQLVAGIGDEIHADAVGAAALAEVVKGEDDELAARPTRRGEVGEPGGEPALGGDALGELDPFRRPALRHPVEGGDQIRIAQAEGQRLAGADGESLDGTLVGVTDDAAPVENEAGVGQCVGEGLNAAFRGDGGGRMGRGGKALGGAGPRQHTNQHQQRHKDRAGREGGDNAGQDKGEQQDSDRDDQPAAFGQPASDPDEVRGPALRTGGNHPG